MYVNTHIYSYIYWAFRCIFRTLVLKLWRGNGGIYVYLYMFYICTRISIYIQIYIQIYADLSVYVQIYIHDIFIDINLRTFTLNPPPPCTVMNAGAFKKVIIAESAVLWYLLSDVTFMTLALLVRTNVYLNICSYVFIYVHKFIHICYR
jgi:hypothetical protein